MSTKNRRSASPSSGRTNPNSSSNNNNNNTGGGGSSSEQQHDIVYDENGNPVINANASPDLQVQLFLEAAGKACVYIENWFKERSMLLKERQHSDLDHEAFQQSRVSEIVQVFRRERPRQEAEVATLRSEKGDLETAIRNEFEQHQNDMKEDRENFERDLRTLEDEIADLTKDEQEAEEWIKVQGPPARDQLRGLLARIEEINLTTEDKVRNMDQDHEETKRAMRESLVLRLRAVRDAAAADAASAGGSGEGGDDTAGGDDGESAAALVGKPTTKTNERLTREVAVYVRESLSLEHSLSNLQSTEASLAAELAAKQNANEKLVLQNAASAKTKKILDAKLKELESQLGQVEKDADKRFTERATSLVDTSSQQAMVINELNDEIDLEVEKLLQLKAELREAQQERLTQKRRARAAARFFLTCSSEVGTTNNKTNNNNILPSDNNNNSNNTDPTADPEIEGEHYSNSNNNSAINNVVASSSFGGNGGDDEENQKTIMFLPTNASLLDNNSGVVISNLGKISGRRDAAQVLMRLFQRE